MPGPLEGLRIIEMAGLGPVPLAGLMLAEMGAAVLRVERMGGSPEPFALPPDLDLSRHGRNTIRLDLKKDAGIEVLRGLVKRADVLMEGFRPGVMERLGLGPTALMERDPALIYARMTGYGQDGPLAARAGHDLNYLAISGVLHAIGPRHGKPVPPLNLVGDYGGGTMLLVHGIMAALLERHRSGEGQIIDAAMTDGASMLAAYPFAFLQAGYWRDERGVNVLDSGAPFYDTYETKDGRYMAVACIEPQFFAEFCRLLPLPEDIVARQYDQTAWPALRHDIAHIFAGRSRAEWTEIFDGSDACVTPVLSLAEAPDHPHNIARRTHVAVGTGRRPAPAPRFSRTPLKVATAPADAKTMDGFGLDRETIDRLVRDGVLER